MTARQLSEFFRGFALLICVLGLAWVVRSQGSLLEESVFLNGVIAQPEDPAKVEQLDRAVLTSSNFQKPVAVDLAAFGKRSGKLENPEAWDEITGKLFLSGATTVERLESYLRAQNGQRVARPAGIAQAHPALSVPYFYGVHVPEHGARKTQTDLMKAMNEMLKQQAHQEIVTLLEPRLTRIFGRCSGPGDRSIVVMGLPPFSEEKDLPLPVVVQPMTITNNTKSLLGIEFKVDLESQQACEKKMEELVSAVESARKSGGQLLLQAQGNQVRLSSRPAVRMTYLDDECVEKVREQWKQYQLQLEANFPSFEESPQSRKAADALSSIFHECEKRVGADRLQIEQKFSEQMARWQKRYNEVTTAHDDPKKWNEQMKGFEMPLRPERLDRSFYLIPSKE